MVHSTVHPDSDIVHKASPTSKRCILRSRRNIYRLHNKTRRFLNELKISASVKMSHEHHPPCHGGICDSVISLMCVLNAQINRIYIVHQFLFPCSVVMPCALSSWSVCCSIVSKMSGMKGITTWRSTPPRIVTALRRVEAEVDMALASQCLKVWQSYSLMDFLVRVAVHGIGMTLPSWGVGNNVCCEREHCFNKQWKCMVSPILMIRSARQRPKQARVRGHSWNHEIYVSSCVDWTLVYKVQ